MAGLRLNPLLAAALQRQRADTDSPWVQSLKQLVRPGADPSMELMPPNATADPGLNRTEPRIDPGMMSAAATTDPHDFTNQYNTPLTPQEEADFQRWAQANGRLRDTYDYDLRGFWKSGGSFDPNSGHGTDYFKKPNHPTFSSQSQYSGREGWIGGAWGQAADGSWTFQPGPTNMMSRDALQQYFRQREPGNRLLYPGAFE